MQPEDDLLIAELRAERDALRQSRDALTAEAARNDDKFRRTQQRELQLLRAEDLNNLLRVLTVELRASYGLPYVSVVLSDPDHNIRHLLLADGTPAGSFSHVLVVESLTGLAPQYIALHQPWLGSFAGCDHQIICPGAEGMKSIAMIPLVHRGKLIGSINLCSDDADRFTRDQASDFLAHLGVIASFCIENTVNRARLLRSGFTDVLTGWHNRRYLSVRLGEELARARRDQTGIVCLMLDVDHFKQVNDSWGHAAGDAVLQELASRIESQVRASDVAARYGGEEFVVLLPGTEVTSAKLLAERIRNVISESSIAIPGGESVSVTVSIGIAEVYPQPGDNDLKTIGDSLIARGRGFVCGEVGRSQPGNCRGSVMRNLLLGVCSLTLLACEPEAELPRYDPVVVWASYEDEAYLRDLFADFTAESRLPVTVKYANSELHLYNLIENIGAEPADVFLSRNIADLWRAADEGALRPIQANNLDNVPPSLKDDDSLWTAINYQTSVIAHAAEAHGPLPLTFSELAGKAFKSRVCLSTSRLSTNLEIVAMLSGEIDTTLAERVVRGWVSNLAKAPFRTEQLLLDAVASGECELAVLSGWAAADLEANADSNFELIRPEPAFKQIEGVGVGRHSRYPQSAHALVDWLLSDQPNKRHARNIGAYAVSDDRHLNPSAQPVGVAGWRHDEAKLLVERAGYR